MKPRAVWCNSQYWNSPIRIGAHHYVRHLVERGWDVAFVSDPISPFHFLKWNTLKETRDRLANWWRGGKRDVPGQLFSYTPFTLLPHHDSPGLRRRWVLDHWQSLTIPNVRKILASRGFHDPDLLVIDSILQSFWLDVLRPRRSVLRIVDDLSGFRGVTPAMLEREHELIRRVDHVVYTARRLESRIASCQPRRMTHVPNGVDLGHFQNRSLSSPPEYTRVPPPRAVYVGSLDDWFDPALVARAARELPGVNFVVIGPVRTDLTSLRGLPNVHLLGRRPYAEVPRYVQFAQVGLIPFRITEMVRSVHPIKLYEYLACGIPVVAMAWEELEGLGSPARLCQSAASFVTAITQALEGPCDHEALVRFAAQADWKNRFDLLARAVGL